MQILNKVSLPNARDIDGTKVPIRMEWRLGLREFKLTKFYCSSQLFLWRAEQQVLHCQLLLHSDNCFLPKMSPIFTLSSSAIVSSALILFLVPSPMFCPVLQHLPLQLEIHFWAVWKFFFFCACVGKKDRVALIVGLLCSNQALQ